MTVGPSLGTLPLVGRADAEALLRSVLAAAAKGVGDCVIIEGPAGIGKSRMLAEARVWADQLGLTVAAGGATELDRVAPPTTMMRALAGCQPPLLSDADLAELRRHGDSRFWLVDRLGDRIEAYSHERALVISLDDVQWADELTALAMRSLVPALRSSPVLWLLARRPLPVRSSTRHTLDWLVADRMARRLTLEPLSMAAVAHLCTEVMGAAPSESLLELVRGSGGNPFLLESLLTTLHDSGRIQVRDGLVVAADQDLPADFLAAVDQRLHDLSGDARRVLDAGSVLGRPFTLHEVAGMLEEHAVRLLDATREAVAAGTLVDLGHGFAFRHDLIREAIYGALSGPARQALHRVAAGVLQGEGKPAPEVAEHLIRGAGPDEPKTLAVVREAVREVGPTAPGAGADLILGLVGSYNGVDPERIKLIADAIRLLVSAGRLGQARELGESYLRRGLDTPVEAALLLGLTEALKHAGQDRAALGYARRALELRELPAHERIHLLAIQAHAMLFADDFPGAERAAAQAAELGAASNEHSAVVFALVARAVAAYARGALDAAAGFAEQAVVLADSVGGEARQRHPRLWQGMALTAMDQFDRAAEVLAAENGIANELGTGWAEPLWHHLHADLWLAAGRLDDAEVVADAGRQVSEELDAAAVAPALLGTLANVAIRRDDLPTALGWLRRAEHYIHGGIGIIAEEVMWEVAIYQDAAGDPGRAIDSLAPLYDAFPERLYLLVDEPWAGPHLVRMALRAGNRDRAELAAHAARVVAEMNPGNVSLAGSADHAEGLFRADRDALHSAVVNLRKSPRGYSRASALEDVGVAEQGAGAKVAAIDLLERALVDYTASGAKRDAARVQRRLRSLGVRVARSRGVRRPTSGWASVTESELRVARLVAEGHTNRQIADRLFLSPHTVDSHIRHAFAKLGVSSRVELTRIVMANDRSA